MNVPVTCRGGLHPPKHQLRLSIERDCRRVEGRMQSAPTKLVCSLSETTLVKCPNYCKKPDFLEKVGFLFWQM
jgi:hypothetical protein